MSSLISESPLTFSAQLAATIGLEEAILLQVLYDAAGLQESPPFTVACQPLAEKLLFWQSADIQRVLKSLADKGVIELQSPPFSQSEQLRYCFDRQVQTTKGAMPARPQTEPAGANRISPYWQPGETVLQQLAQHNIPADFARHQVNEFVTYWRDRGEISHSWNARFYKHVVREWQHQRNRIQTVDSTPEPRPLQQFWQPSEDALEILERNGINRRFIEDAVPEFVLYWREKGAATTTWNSKFIQHVKRQWARYTSTLQHDTEPRRIPANWQPSPDVFDILKMANIDADFARRCVKEFVLYWKDSNQLHSSWNTKFLQHVKYCWANQLTGQPHARQQNPSGQGAKANGGFFEKHTDRSWADGL